MSLFTLRDVWSFDSSESGSTTFSVKSLCIGNIDNEGEEGNEKIILGSYSGVLRVINAGIEKDAEGAPSNQGNLLAEFNLGGPILQVVAGYFVGGSSNLHLAILHPQKLGIYSFSKITGQVEHGSQYKVTLLYEHQLKRIAFNMCFGAFGQTPSKPGSGTQKSSGRRDFICVQSLDGTLSFFEQEVFSFSRYLPNFLLPGPIEFLSTSDSFLTINSSWELQCFRYSSLAKSKDETVKQTEETVVGKRLSPDWSCSIGEEPVGDIQILLHPIENDESKIIIVTFRLMFCFSIAGELLWSKRLEYSVSCFTSYLNSSNECITIIASSGTDLGALYMYNGTCLKWAAKLQFPPVSIGRIQVHDVPGGLVLLGNDGHISVNVLGTEPSLFIAPPIQSRELDYEAAEKELQMLRKLIADAGEQSVVATKESIVDIKVEFEGQKSIWVESTGLEAIALIATVKILCRVRVNDVRVNISSPNPIICTQPSTYIGDIVGRHNYSVEFYLGNEFIPSDVQCDVCLFYLSDAETPHFIHKTGIKIPLFIITRPYEQVDKQGECKLTFAVNKPVLNLITLYNDFDWNPEINSNGLTFLLHGGEKVTILASTKAVEDESSRYRIQSDSMAAMHLILRDFLDRLQRKYGREKSAFEISLVSTGEMPLLNEYFNEIDTHMIIRRRELQIKEDISGRAAQLRAIQRRILIRFRDKNALPMTQLEILLEGSLEQILDALNFMELNETEKEKSNCRLSGATRLLLDLCLIQNGRSSELSILNDTLCPYLWGFSEESGWEECVYSGLSYLKTNQTIPSPSIDQMDPIKFKKLIKTNLEKFKNLTQPIPKAKHTTSSVSRTEPELVGNEIAERMMSARTRNDRRRNQVLAAIPEPPGDGDEDTRVNSPRSRQEGSNHIIENHAENTDSEPVLAHLKNSISKDFEPKSIINGSTIPIIENNNTDEKISDDNFW